MYDIPYCFFRYFFPFEFIFLLASQGRKIPHNRKKNKNVMTHVIINKLRDKQTLRTMIIIIIVLLLQHSFFFLFLSI